MVRVELGTINYHIFIAEVTVCDLVNIRNRKSTINKTQHRQYRDQKYYIVPVLYIAIDKQL